MITCRDFLKSFITGIFSTISFSDGHTWSDVTLIGPAEGHIRESRSEDEGCTWSEPRFVFAGVTPGGHIHSCSYIDMLADGSRIHIFLGQAGRQLLYLHFDESSLPRFLTKADLVTAVQNPLAKRID